MRTATLPLLAGLLAASLGVRATLDKGTLPRLVGEAEAHGARHLRAPAAQDAPAGDGVVTAVSKLSQTTLPAGAQQDVHLYLGLSAADLPEVVRPGMNLALVIDRSGSMGSEDKLHYAKSAAEQLVGRLRDDDQLAIVVYDDEINTLVPSTPASERSVFMDALRSLVPGDSTNLYGGMMGGYEQVLLQHDDQKLNRVLLLSDGLANKGVTELASILERADGCRGNGVAISTMGMGLEYDEELLSGIAQHAGGNYYYVDEAEVVGRHLDREIDQLSRIVARNLNVHFELGEGVELVEVYGYPFKRTDTGFDVPVEDLYSSQRRKIVLRLRLQGDVGERKQVIQTSLSYRTAEGGESTSFAHPAHEVGFSDDLEEIQGSRNKDVMVKVEVVQNALALDAAMKLHKAGNFEAAQELLTTRYRIGKLFNDTELRSAENQKVLDRIQQVLLDLERTKADAKAQRDIQLLTGLQGLGYIGDD